MNIVNNAFVSCELTLSIMLLYLPPDAGDRTGELIELARCLSGLIVGSYFAGGLNVISSLLYQDTIGKPCITNLIGIVL